MNGWGFQNTTMDAKIITYTIRIRSASSALVSLLIRDGGMVGRMMIMTMTMKARPGRRREAEKYVRDTSDVVT